MIEIARWLVAFVAFVTAIGGLMPTTSYRLRERNTSRIPGGRLMPSFTMHKAS
jgi:hypothetical protein